MPYTSANTTIVEGANHGIANGKYIPVIRPDIKNKLQVGQGNIANLIVWNREQVVRTYPLMSEHKAQRERGVIGEVQGGVKMDIVYSPLATFGIYFASGQTWKLREWYDFDHWPMDDNDSLMDNMANGHKHCAPNMKIAQVLNPLDSQLAMRVAAFAKTGQFPG
jgi:hypothetical protein